MLSKPLSILRTAFFCAFSLLATGALAQTTINVGPGQTYTTIQSGINAAVNGDTVLVAPGTYYENINFKGKAITVTSSGGAASTVIDGGSMGPAVTFSSSEPRTAVLSKMTVQHGGKFTYTSATGGIYILNSSPTILNNTITQNNCWDIYAEDSAPLIQGNEISATQDPKGSCSFSGGAGISIWGNLNSSSTTNNGSSPLIIGNTIEDNVESGLEDAGGNGGAAIAVWGGSPVIENNTLRNNSSPGGSGGAINIDYGAGVAVVQNLIYGNSAGCGGGAIAFQGNADPRTGIGVLIANNTIVNNVGQATAGYSECASISQIYPGPDLYGTSNPYNFVINNIISGSTSEPAVNCSWYQGPNLAYQATFEYSILYNSGGPFFGSYCVDVSNQDNNIPADPQFLDPASNNYHLKSTSPAIDSGQSNVLQIFQNLTGLTLATDFDGNPRVQNPTGKGCIIDMGAYEYPGSSGSCGTTETLQSSLNPSLLGQTVTFTAQLSSTAGVPTGTVQFLDGTTVLGTQAVSSTGVSAYSTGLLTIGSHSITANYQPTGSFGAGTASLTQVVNGYATTTSLTCSPSTIFIGGTGLLSATVTSSNGLPTGSIAFTDNGAALVSENLVGGIASLTYTGVAVGTHTLTATYVPTGAFSGSSATCSEVVTALPTTSVLTVNPTTTTLGNPVTLSATVSPVTPPGAGVPTGIVNFFNGTTAIGNGTLANGVATLAIGNLPGGVDNLTCTYGGSTSYASSNCNSVPVMITAQASTLTLTSGNNPAAALSPVQFVAHLTVNGQSAGAGNSITLTVNGQTVNLTTDASGSASYTINTLTPGSYPVAAAFAGSSSLLASSAALVEVVTAIPTTTTVSVTPNPAYVTQTVTMVASTSANATSAPITSGTVTFLDGATLLSSQSVGSGGTASYSTSTLALGTHPITAVFAASSNVFTGSSSAVVNEVILPSGFTISLSPATITLAPGTSGTAAIGLASVGNFAGPLTLSYGSLPTYATASISPATVSLAAGGTGASAIKLNTLLKSANDVPPRPGSRTLPVVFAALFILLMPLRGVGRKRIVRLLSVGLLMIALQATNGCTNDWYIGNYVAAGTYQVPVTATDVNGNTQTANLTVVITP